MQLVPRVTFRGVNYSEALAADIADHVARLETYYPAITACHVVVEIPEHHHRSGNRFHVRINLSVPGDEIVVTSSPSLHAELRDSGEQETTKEDETSPERRYARVAIREAFEIARRRLQDFSRKQRGFVKAHATPTEPQD